MDGDAMDIDIGDSAGPDSAIIIPKKGNGNGKNEEMGKLENDGKHIQEAFKYVTISMHVFGIVFITPKGRPCSAWIVLSLCYYILVLILSWANVIRYFWAYESGERFAPPLVFKVLYHSGHIISAGIVTLSIKYSRVRFHLMEQWNEYYVKYQIYPEENIKTIKCRSTIGLIAVMVLLVHTFAMPFEPIGGEMKNIMAAPFNSGCSTSGVCSVEESVMMIVGGLIGTPPLPLTSLAIILVTTALKNEYKAIHQDLKASLSEQSLDLEAIRHRHMDLGKIVAAADKSFSLAVLAFLTWAVMFTCVTIYVLMLDDILPLERNLLIGVLALVLVPMLLLVGAGTALNEKVCEICSIDLSSTFAYANTSLTLIHGNTYGE